MEQVLFVGRFYSEESLKTAIEDSKYNLNLSNHNFEMSIFDGLKQNLGKNFSCITVPQNYSYPRHCSKIYTHGEFYYKDGIYVKRVSLCNLPIIKDIWGTLSLTYCICLYCVNCSSKKLYILVNSQKNVLMLSVLLASILSWKQVRKVLIIPDVSSMVTKCLTKNKLRRSLVNIIDFFSDFLANRFDGYVFLTEQMKELFSHKKYIVMEGLLTNRNLCESSVVGDGGAVKSFLYTGSLDRIYGIMDLIDAFEKLNRLDVELWICGAGDSVKEIKIRTGKNSKIKFFGFVSPTEAANLQRKAMVLVNPRKDNGDYTKYSFPSKTLEYMMARKPVIMHKLPGVPSDYYDYVFFPTGDSIEEFADVMNTVMNMDPDILQKRVQEAYDFVSNNKNSKVQMKRVLDLLFC